MYNTERVVVDDIPIDVTIAENSVILATGDYGGESGLMMALNYEYVGENVDDSIEDDVETMLEAGLEKAREKIEEEDERE